MKNNQCKFKSCRGGAIAELLVTLPLLLLLFAGMAFLGRKLSLFGVISQTTFNAAMYAAGLNSSDVNGETTTFANTLFNSSQRSQSFVDHAFNVSYTDLDADSRADLVTVSFDGNVSGLGFASAFGVSPLLVNTTLPVLGSGASSTSVDPNFQNPLHTYCPDGSYTPCSVIANPDDGKDGCTIVQGYCKYASNNYHDLVEDDGGGNKYSISDDGKTIIMSR